MTKEEIRKCAIICWKRDRTISVGDKEEDSMEFIRVAETDAVTTDEDGTTRVKMALLDKSGRLDPEEIY